MFDTANSSSHQGARQVAAVFAVAALLIVPLRGVIEPKVETVSLYLNVEKNDGLTSGLSERNFRLYVDGEPRTFRLEKPEVPASIALLVEYGNSSGYFAADLDAALEGFLQHAPEGHWYALATFSHGLEIHTDFTRQTGEIAAAYSQLSLPAWREIDTYDTVYEMLDKMGKLPGRRILIVVGSGLDTFSQHSLDHVKQKAESENVTIFAAGLGSVFRGSYEAYLGASSRMRLLQAQAFLQMLASKSGGFAWFPNQSGAFGDVMQGIMQSIATQYRLVYESEAPRSGKFRKIRVEAFRIENDLREDFKVLVREGWR